VSAGSAHWDAAYAQGETTRSWFQEQAAGSLRLLGDAGVPSTASVLDVGGGAARFVDGLLARGHHDVTVLDVSPGAIELARRRLGRAADHVNWIEADLLDWQPGRRYDVWHDRALLHFLTGDGERRRYVELLDAATEPGSVAVLATFAPDGPDHCSGLPVLRYAAADLEALLGAHWQVIRTDREEHRTPGGAGQPFTWIVARRKSSDMGTFGRLT
jgi:trans-aconitate methyltransferase